MEGHSIRKRSLPNTVLDRSLRRMWQVRIEVLIFPIQQVAGDVSKAGIRSPKDLERIQSFAG